MRERSLKSAVLSQSVRKNGFSLNSVDFLVKPQLEGLLCLAVLESGESSAVRIKRNMVTGDMFALVQFRDIPNQNIPRTDEDAKDRQTSDK